MLQVCGYNDNFQLGENYNSTITNIVESHINAKTILSYSIYQDHAVYITTNGKIYAIGNNVDSRISGSLPRQTISHFQEFTINDLDGSAYIPISVLCGENYTLYIVSKPDDTNKFYATYSYSGLNCSNPLLLNFDSRNPIALFGNNDKAAIIDSEGSITFILPNHRTITSYLPKKARAISVVIWDDFIFALDSEGNLFQSSLASISFSEVTELKGIQIEDISGSCDHCFAISNTGSVYARGQNKTGKLGLDDIKYAYQFTEIQSLKKYKIKSVSTSRYHSLFMTSEGQILACGNNRFGQLILGKPSKGSIFAPTETVIKKDATLIIAGNSLSAIFLNYIPPNSSNRPVTKTNPINLTSSTSKKEKKSSSEIESKSTSKNCKSKSASIKRFHPKISSTETNEIDQLRKENEMLREKVKSLESALEAKSTSTTTKVTRKSREKPPEPIETKTIDELRRIELIGKGAQSSVYKVARDEYLALKEIDMPDPEEEEEKNDEFSNAFVKMKKLLQEIEIINHLDHPNIIKGYGICFGDESHLPSILIEYCPKNLNEAIKDMDDIKRVTTVFEICLAMSAVHEAHIIHRNLKPENILIDCEDHVKISDFGMSRLEDFEMCMSSKTAGVGSLKFKAPEVLNESTSYNEKVDVYSFGVILYFILTRGSFPKINIIDIGLGKKAQIPKCVNELSRNLINQCWSTDPDDRPSFSELVEIIKENKFKLIDGVEKEITYIVQFLSL